MAIKFTKGMIPLIMKPTILQNGYFKVFACFEGLQPSKAQIEALYTDTNLSMGDVSALGTLRGFYNYPASFTATKLSANFYRWDTALRPEEMVVAELGNVDWFFFAVVEGSLTDPNGTNIVRHMYIGNVTDSDNEGEMKLVNKSLGGSLNYLLNDLEISYRT